MRAPIRSWCPSVVKINGEAWVRCITCVLLIVLSSLGVGGCMSIRLEEFRQTPTQLRAGESIVVLARQHLDGTRTEAGFLSCVSRRLAGAELAVAATPTFAAGADMAVRPALFNLFPNRRFVDSLYPWLEPSMAPTSAGDFERFLARPGVRERVTSMGVRYIVWVDGKTEKTDSGGSISCGISAGGAGCFGFGWWESEANYEATIWDLLGGVGAGGVSTRVRGTSAIAGVVVPVPFIAPVQRTACKRLSSQLEAFLAGRSFD